MDLLKLSPIASNRKVSGCSQLQESRSFLSMAAFGDLQGYRGRSKLPLHGSRPVNLVLDSDHVLLLI